MTATTATVETLTAQVRVLAMNTRQITLSIAKQLDIVPAEDIEPFGRIKADWLGGAALLKVIGRHRETGVLAVSKASRRDEVTVREMAEHSPHLFRFVEGDRWSYQRWSCGWNTTANGREIHAYRYQGEALESVTGTDSESPERMAEYETAMRNVVAARDAYADTWAALPLIVLAGSR